MDGERGGDLEKGNGSLESGIVVCGAIDGEGPA
jgi:hypothetical protein